MALGLRYLGRDGEAEAWKALVEALPCPQATKDVFLRRGELVVERSREAGAMLLV